MKIGANGLQIMEVGNTVKYFPVKEGDADVKTNGNNEGPIAAIVTRVWGDDQLCNLMVFPDHGQPVTKSSVHQNSSKLGEEFACYVPN